MLEPQQLSLGVTLNDDATFDNFHAPSGSSNAQASALVRAQAEGLGEQVVFLWGAPGVGLTHLLQAGCHRAHDSGLSFQYLPLQELIEVEPHHLFEGLEALEYICIDNLEAVAGRADWEEALFHLFNRVREQGHRLLLAAHKGPHQLPIELADLRSRLQWGVTWQLQALADIDKQQALRQRARARGLELSDEVAQYILQRVSRDMDELFRCLQRLDQASLAAQRKLTIPFVKKVLSI